MSARPAPAPRSLADEIFDDLDKRWKAPDPEAIGGQVERFDRFLGQLVLPFAGINAFLVGSLVYRSTTQLQAAPALLGLLALLAWAALVPQRTRHASSLHLGGVAAVVLMLLLSVPQAGVAWVLGLMWTVAIVVAIGQHAVPERALVLYVLYLPLLAEQAFDGTARIGFQVLTLLPLTAWMVLRRAHAAATAGLVGCAIAGAQSLSWMPRGSAMLVVLCATLVVLAIAYEWRLPAQAESSLRQFLGQGVTVVALLLVFAAVLDLSQHRHLWAWAGTAALLQAAKMAQERLARPTRAAWAAFPLVYCLWFATPGLGWDAEVLGTLLLASAVHAVASAAGSRFTATLALLPAAAAVVPVLERSDAETSLHVVAAGLALAGFFWLASRTRPTAQELPAWRGFIAEAHARQLRAAALAVGAQVLRIPLVSNVFSLLRRLVTWVRYMKGSGGPLTIGDLSLVAAHATAAWVLSQQVSNGLTHAGDPVGARVALAAAVWVAWGLGLYGTGSRTGRVFHRLLGTCFVIAPAVVVIGWVAPDDRTAIALVALVAGVGAWLAGASARAAPALPAAAPAADDRDDETG
jgi:hypothetical protein